jgi:hypothetical protein
VALASFASCPVGDIGDADDVGVAGDVRGDTVWATVRGCGFCGLATCFGASTTTSGSMAAARLEVVAVCDIAVPLRPHRSRAIDEIATVGLATNSDENLIAMSSKCGDSQFRPGMQDITFRCELPPRNLMKKTK